MGYAIALVFLVRLLSLIPPVIDDDEGWFAASANALEGWRSFFRRALDDKPPGTVWFDALVRWVVGPLHLAQWSRLAGLVVLALTAWMVARIARRVLERAPAGGEGSAGMAALTFLLAAGAFTPKLFALTNEQLMLAPITLAVLAALDDALAPRMVRWLVAGAAIGMATWLKQTSLVFLLPVLIACDGAAAAVLVLLAFALTAFAGAWAVGLRDYWLWTAIYPREVLVAARRSLFAGWSDGVQNALVFGLALLPVLWRAFQGTRRLEHDRRSWVLAGWVVAALTAIAAGKGLFPHYFLLVLPPVAVVAGVQLAQVPFSRLQGLWISLAYVGCALASAWPVTNLFWGNDLPYFVRAGDRIAQLSAPSDRVFLWGGSPVPLALSGRRNATRFLTSRFLVQPYANEETLRLFRDDLLADPPPLIVDVHARGDNMQNLPPASIPWLGELLATRYRLWADPALPWTRFYVRQDRAASEPPAGLCASKPLEDAREGYPRSLAALRKALATLRSSPERPDLAQLQRLDLRLRASFSLELLATSCVGPEFAALEQSAVPAPSASGQALDPSTLRAQVERLYAEHRFAPPLPLASELWWVELAIAEMQPVIRPRPAP